MRLVTVKFVVPDEEYKGFEHDFYNSQLLNDYMCWEFSWRDATDVEIQWYKEEMREDG